MKKTTRLILLAVVAILITAVSCAYAANPEKNKVYVAEGAKMPDPAGLQIGHIQSAWNRLSKAANFNAYLRYDDKDEINAYITKDQGEYVVVVYRGLLKAFKKENELGGVLGHEIGHGVRRHLDKMTGTGVLVAGAILTQIFDLGTLGDIAVMGAAALAAQGYSREHEVEADDFGVEYSAKAGYSPWSLYDSIKRMADAGQVTEPSGFNSHPPTERRMKRLANQARKWEKELNIAPRDDSWQDDHWAKDDDSTSEKTEAPAKSDKPADIKTSGKGSESSSNQKQSEQKAKSKPAPIKVKGVDPNTSDQVAVMDTYPIDKGLRNTISIMHRRGVSCYSSGNYKLALDAFGKAFDAYDGNYLSALWAARSAQKLGQRKAQVRVWIDDKALAANPDYKPAKQFAARYLK